MPPPLLVILGPTASGKSALAIAIAERIGAEILSVDSMQVYRGMDVGTAKPTADERLRVPHHLIDVVEPSEVFTVARFVELADAAIADSKARGGPLIATGGTPLYYKALFEGLFEGPCADAAFRDSLADVPDDSLHARLAGVDPITAARLHVNDRRRVIRALEVHALTGQSISSLQQEWAGGEHRHAATWFGLNWDRETINRRINARAKQMLDADWLEEARQLRTQTLSKTAAEATGYRQLFDVLDGRAKLDDAVEEIKIETRQLARKQMKWFRRFGQVNWLDGASDLSKLADAVVASCTTSRR